MPVEPHFIHHLPLTRSEILALRSVLTDRARIAPRDRHARDYRRMLSRLDPEYREKNIQRILDVSTRHLTTTEIRGLEFGAVAGQDGIFDHGGIVHVGVYTGDLDELRDYPGASIGPLIMIMRYAIDRGCEWVVFHPNAPCLTEFPLNPID